MPLASRILMYYESRNPAVLVTTRKVKTQQTLFPKRNPAPISISIANLIYAFLPCFNLPFPSLIQFAISFPLDRPLEPDGLPGLYFSLSLDLQAKLLHVFIILYILIHHLSDNLRSLQPKPLTPFSIFLFDTLGLFLLPVKQVSPAQKKAPFPFSRPFSI